MFPEELPSKIDDLPVKEGDRLFFRTAGAGAGRSSGTPAGGVSADVRRGLVSSEAARRNTASSPRRARYHPLRDELAPPRRALPFRFRRAPPASCRPSDGSTQNTVEGRWGPTRAPMKMLST